MPPDPSPPPRHRPLARPAGVCALAATTGAMAAAALLAHGPRHTSGISGWQAGLLVVFLVVAAAGAAAADWTRARLSTELPQGRSPSPGGPPGAHGGRPGQGRTTTGEPARQSQIRRAGFPHRIISPQARTGNNASPLASTTTTGGSMPHLTKPSPTTATTGPAGAVITCTASGETNRPRGGLTAPAAPIPGVNS